MRQLLGGIHGVSERLAPPGGRRIVADCTTIDEGVVRTALFWLAAEAARSRLDAIIVMPSLIESQALACALPSSVLQDLVAGNVVRMNQASLQLLAPHEVMPQIRRHQVVLTIGLNESEVRRVDRMNPAALFVVRRLRQ